MPPSTPSPRNVSVCAAPEGLGAEDAGRARGGKNGPSRAAHAVRGLRPQPCPLAATRGSSACACRYSGEGATEEENVRRS